TMMRKIHLISVLAFILSMSGCTGSGNSQQTKRAVNSAGNEAAQQSGTSLFASSRGKPDCDLSLNLVNSTFRLARLYSRKSPVRHVLIRERSTQTGCTNSEGLTGTIAIEGWVDKFDAGTIPTWQAQSEGHEGNIDGDFYKITKHGCCGSTEASVYFNL